MPRCSLKLFVCLCVLPIAVQGLALRASAVTLDIRVNASANDATQDSGGSMKLTDSTMKFEVSTWMGLRFTSVTIPQGAYIKAAYVTFRANSSTTPTTTPTIYGQNVSSAAIFTSSSNNISSRARTTATVSWSMPSWTSGQNYNTPSLKGIVQEIVNRSDWASGNSLAVLINTLTSGADRITQAYDGSSSLAPLLHVEYVVVTRPVANRLLFVVTNTSTPTAQETARSTFFQDIGYTVTLIAANASQATYDTQAAANDVAYVNEQITSGDLNTKLKAKTIGIVNEEPALADDYAVSSTSANPSATAISISKNTHYITSPFSTGSLTIVGSSQPLNQFTGTTAPDLNTLATVSSTASLVVVEANGELYDSTFAAGRRVFVPWGSGVDFNQLNDNGLYLLSRTLAWAGGMVAYWKLDESSGTSASESTPTTNTGTLTNLSFATDAVSNARVNGGLKFNGTDDYISVADATELQVTKAMSFSAWIKGESWGSGSAANVVVRKGDANPNNYQFAVENGYLALGLDGNDGTNAHNTTLLTTNTWYHVVATWDGTTIRFYVNGVADGTTARSGTILTDTRALYLGGRSGSTDGFDGTIDDVRFFNYALGTDEITDIFNQGSIGGVQLLKWVEIQ